VNNAVFWDETVFDWKELTRVSENVLPSSDSSSYQKEHRKWKKEVSPLILQMAK
jgi:hypothetical protein